MSKKKRTRRRRSSGPVRPAPISVGPLRCRVHRGPNDAGLWYWRIFHKTESLFADWSTEEDITAKAGDLLARGDFKRTTSIAKVGDLCDAWVRTQRNRMDLKPATRRSIVANMRRVSKAIGHVSISSAPTSLESYRDTRFSAGAAPSTIALELRMLRSAWKWARQRELIPFRLVLPAVRIVPRRVNCGRTPEQAEALQVEAWLEANSSPWQALWMKLARFTGARVGEIASLRPTDLTLQDLDSASIRIVGKGDRGGDRVREVPICRALAERLSVWVEDRDPHSLLFGVTYNTASRHPIRALRKACDALGLPRFTPHGVRRLRVRELRRAGVPIRVAADLLGHSPQVMLKLYDASSLEDKQAAIRLTDEVDRSDEDGR